MSKVIAAQNLIHNVNSAETERARREGKDGEKERKREREKERERKKERKKEGGLNR